MTLNQFRASPVVRNEAACELLHSEDFQKILDYAVTAPEAEVRTLLNGAWMVRKNLSDTQISALIKATLFPEAGIIRFGASLTALMLAEASGQERDIQQWVSKTWAVSTRKQASSFLAGLSSYRGIEKWSNTLRQMYINRSEPGLRQGILDALDNHLKLHPKSNIRSLYSELLSM